jgi:tetratricopeptide (TPR) repeat protein
MSVDNKGGKNVTLPPELNTETASAMVAAKGLVQHGVGQKEIDEKISLGYLSVNTGNFTKAIEIFNNLLSKNSNIVAAYLGRGTAYALAGDLDKVKGYIYSHSNTFSFRLFWIFLVL